MAIPSEIVALIDRLNQELNETEQGAIRGLTIIRPLLTRFGDNPMLIRHFAYFNNSLLLVEFSRNKIDTIIERISSDEVNEQQIQEAGEDLGEQLGRLLEARINIRSIITTWEELP